MSGASQVGRGARRIVFVRHGQTDFNVERRFQGVIDRPLNDHGRRQARQAGVVLASRVLTPSAQVGVNVAPQARPRIQMLCSPLSRAHETAQILHACFLDAGANVDGLSVDERLIERDFGVFEGFTAVQIEQTHAAELAQWRDTGECVEAGIERSDAVGARMADACEDAARSAGEESTLVVVSHGSAIIRGILTLIGLDPLSFDGMRGLDNCHWSEVVRMGGGGSGASGRASWRLTSHNIGHREDVLGA